MTQLSMTEIEALTEEEYSLYLAYGSIEDNPVHIHRNDGVFRPFRTTQLTTKLARSLY